MSTAPPTTIVCPTMLLPNIVPAPALNTTAVGPPTVKTPMLGRAWA